MKLEIFAGKGLGEINLGSFPQDIPDLIHYELGSIPSYCSEFDGRRSIAVNYIDYLFREGEGLLAITLNESGIKEYDVKLWGKSLSNTVVGDIQSLLKKNDSEYTVGVDPYGEGDIDDISSLTNGLIFYFDERRLESVEIFTPSTST